MYQIKILVMRRLWLLGQSHSWPTIGSNLRQNFGVSVRIRIERVSAYSRGSAESPKFVTVIPSSLFTLVSFAKLTWSWIRQKYNALTWILFEPVLAIKSDSSETVFQNLNDDVPRFYRASFDGRRGGASQPNVQITFYFLSFRLLIFQRATINFLGKDTSTLVPVTN